jgi:hypothetical protein
MGILGNEVFPMSENHRKRPRDPAQLAKLIVDIATGEVEDGAPEGKAPARAKGGKIGGRARAIALSNEERSAIARTGAKARWGKRTPE